MPQSRAQVCESASRKLSAAAPTLSDVRVPVGLDGFVDEIIAVVDKRHEHRRLDAIATIEGVRQENLCRQRAIGISSWSSSR